MMAADAETMRVIPPLPDQKALALGPTTRFQTEPSQRFWVVMAFLPRSELSSWGKATDTSALDRCVIRPDR
jgi:hypothetical protein